MLKRAEESDGGTERHKSLMGRDTSQSTRQGSLVNLDGGQMPELNEENDIIVLKDYKIERNAFHSLIPKSVFVMRKFLLFHSEWRFQQNSAG